MGAGCCALIRRARRKQNGWKSGKQWSNSKGQKKKIHEYKSQVRSSLPLRKTVKFSFQRQVGYVTERVGHVSGGSIFRSQGVCNKMHSTHSDATL